MANFPTNLDTIKKDWTNDSPVKDTHPSEHNLVAESVEALEVKVGVDGSAVTTTHDYKLSGATGSDKASTLAGTETLTNKTLTAPTLNTPTSNTPILTTPTMSNPVINGNISGTGILDEDDLSTDSATALATQRSIKAYVDANASEAVYKAGISTKNIADASGTQTIAHGLGTTPKKISLTNLFASGQALLSSIGVLSSSGNTMVLNAERSGTSYVDNSITYAILLGNPNLGNPLINNQTGVVTVDSTNITITWTKNGSPTGTHNFMWEAQG